MKNIHRSLIIGCSLLALSACGPDDIASPGATGPVTVNIGGSSGGTPTPTPGTGTVEPAGACPTIADPQGLTDKGTITGPTGTWRVCELPARFNVSTTLPKLSGLLYSIRGRVDVGCDGGYTAPTDGTPYTSTTPGCEATPLKADTNVTLTIAPGAILYGATGQSWLAVNRGNKINAVGTSSAPIVFTSADNVAGFNSDSSMGQWGGVVLMGRAKVTDCDFGSVDTQCERKTEGSAYPAVFGGGDDTYNAGKMSYVQIRYSGFVLGANKELQALTLEGVGSGTQIDHFQSHNSSDDGMEVFGGNMGMKYYISTGADDDSLDVDTGARFDLQYAILAQRSGQGDALMEIDSDGKETDTPRTRLRVANFVAIQPEVSSNNEGNDKASTLFRGNSDTTLINGIIATPKNECIRMTGSGGANGATLTARSVVMTCSGDKYIGSGEYDLAKVKTFFGSGANGNNDSLTSTLTNGFVNGSNEDGVTAIDAAAYTTSSFFEVPSPNKIGAAWSGNTSWYTGWTCNSSTAALGGASNCTSLPTT
ncbi:MAG: hypothetical protein BGO57_10970 [Sphingomonadales bacterium 63-6]|nr:MAG: hypothetical protein BGO57_10970 [Sphingomonadales bacterium 63-6]